MPTFFVILYPCLVIFWVYKISSVIQEVSTNRLRLEAEYKKDQSLRAERKELVNYIINHGQAELSNEKYKLILKKLDGKNTTLDEMLVISHEKTLLHAQKRLYQIGDELGDHQFQSYLGKK
jgi:hypothetical protein